MDESDRRLQDEVRARLRDLDRLLEPGKRAARAVGDVAAPAWRQVTEVESRVAVSAALIVAIVLMSVLPARIANHPRWLLPALAGVLFLIVIVLNPMRPDSRSLRLRPFAFALLALLSLGNAASAVRLIIDLVRGEGLVDPAVLLLTGAAVWTTNMILFAVWYWEFDRGGPAARAMGTDPYPDFLFPQMTSPEFAPAEWEPHFIDYLYLSFTNATAFSPTDVMPLTHWTKLTMLGQSAVSLVIVILVVARSVNIL